MEFARMKMELALDAQKRQEFSRALVFFKEAYDYFTRIDDVEGKIEAGLAAARQCFYLGSTEGTEKWLDRISGLIDTFLPHMAASRAVLLAEMAFEEKNYAAVVDIAAGTITTNIEWKTELLCSAMISKLKLDQDYRPLFQQVEATLPVLQKQFDKRKLRDPGVLSLAYYNLGYVYTVEKNWQTALLHFEKARTVDSQTDNARGLANDLYSIGRCCEKLNRSKMARSVYRRAAEIFTLLKDKTMAANAKNRAASLAE
jgi:tetratricopeptide (TPR) repeat protein